MPKEELSAVMEQIAAAVKGGDSSLKGDAGKKLLETAKANAAANPNMDDAAKADAEAKAAADAAKAGAKGLRPRCGCQER